MSPTAMSPPAVSLAAADRVLALAVVALLVLALLVFALLVLQRAVSTLAARRTGRQPGEVGTLLKEARDALGLVRRSGAAHNPLAADALLGLAREKAEQARAHLGKR